MGRPTDIHAAYAKRHGVTRTQAKREAMGAMHGVRRYPPDPEWPLTSLAGQTLALVFVVLLSLPFGLAVSAVLFAYDVLTGIWTALGLVGVMWWGSITRYPARIKGQWQQVKLAWSFVRRA